PVATLTHASDSLCCAWSPTAPRISSRLPPVPATPPNRRPPNSAPSPYTTLFRSQSCRPRPRPPPTGRPESRRDWPPTRCPAHRGDRKSTRLNSSHVSISYAVFCLKTKTEHNTAAKDPSAELLHVSRGRGVRARLL